MSSVQYSPDGQFLGYGRSDATVVLARNPYAAQPGDLNCDGHVNFGDINPFVQLLSDPQGWQQQYPNCPLLNGDCNGDGLVDFGDINPFVALLSIGAVHNE